MNALSLALSSIRSRPLQSALCVTAASAGVALLAALLLLSQGVQDGFLRNAQGIDVVVGAKGSPLQLVLSSVYHADVPTGNIDIRDMEKLQHNPKVKSIIPVALGDNYRGFRIVGTMPEYLAHYGAQYEDGKMFAAPFDAVAGALTGLKTGDSFAGVHGLAADGGDVHHFHDYKITGVLKPTGTVLDRLIVTALGSVQELHRHPDIGDPDAAQDMEVAHQVTALLVKVKRPIATMSLPREINATSNMIAASPSYEMARLSQSLGFGRDLLAAVGIGFVALSALMLLSSLASSLSARRYDLGVLRVLGASPETLAGTVAAEGVMLAGAGTVAGIALGHLLAYEMAANISSLGGVVAPASFLQFHMLDGCLLLMGLVTGLFAAVVPAVSAARTDIAGLLARGRA
ncbi:MAG: ABC transporter permease [Alphaproteobacteria bacterium]|nr:ABC transporter permease [Alphaproteobacteria bacterium]